MRVLVAVALFLTGCAGRPHYESEWVDFSGADRDASALRMTTYACNAAAEQARQQFLLINPPQDPNQTNGGRYVVPYCVICEVNRQNGLRLAGEEAFENCMGAHGWEKRRFCVRNCP